MPQEQVFTLESPEVRAKKEVWEKNVNCRNAKREKRADTEEMSFEALFAYFQNGGSYVALAKRLDTTRQAVQQMHKVYFKDICGGKSGRELHVEQMRVRTQANMRTREQKFFVQYASTVGRVAILAREAGCTVEVLTGAGSNLRKHSLRINGHHCRMYFISSVCVQGDLVYYRTYIDHKTISAADTVVIYAKCDEYPEQLLVVPASELLRLWSGRDPVRSYLLHIPVIRRRSGRINLGRYRNAWHLLAPKTVAE